MKCHRYAALTAAWLIASIGFSADFLDANVDNCAVKIGALQVVDDKSAPPKPRPEVPKPELPKPDATLPKPDVGPPTLAPILPPKS